MDRWGIRPPRCGHRYQAAIYGFGYFPGDPQIGRIYAWMGFRVGVIGDLK